MTGSTIADRGITARMKVIDQLELIRHVFLWGHGHRSDFHVVHIYVVSAQTSIGWSDVYVLSLGKRYRAGYVFFIAFSRLVRNWKIVKH